MSDSQSNGLPAAAVETERRMDVLSALADADDQVALNALLSAFCNRAYRSGKRLGASAVLQKMGRRMQRCGSPEEFANPPPASIPLPVLPDRMPAGYSDEDLVAVVQLCTELSYLLDGWKNHVGMSALLSMYCSVSELTLDQDKAGMCLIAAGSALVEQHAKTAAAAAGMPAGASGTVH